MQGNTFTSITDIESLGESLFCVYFYSKYDRVKAEQYLRWKGFRTDLFYRLNECLIYYQDEKYIPDLDVVDNFYKELDEYNVWEKANGLLYDYKYRVLSKGVICISYIPIDAYTYPSTGKLKKE